jgi:hypothetical protein
VESKASRAPPRMRGGGEGRRPVQDPWVTWANTMRASTSSLGVGSARRRTSWSTDRAAAGEGAPGPREESTAGAWHLGGFGRIPSSARCRSPRTWWVDRQRPTKNNGRGYYYWRGPLTNNCKTKISKVGSVRRSLVEPATVVRKKETDYFEFKFETELFEFIS